MRCAHLVRAPEHACAAGSATSCTLLQQHVSPTHEHPHQAAARTVGSMDTSTSAGISRRSASSRFCLAVQGGTGCAGRGRASEGGQDHGPPLPAACAAARPAACSGGSTPPRRSSSRGTPAARPPPQPRKRAHLRRDGQLALVSRRAAGAGDDVRVLAAHEPAAHAGLLLLQHRVELLGACGAGRRRRGGASVAEQARRASSSARRAAQQGRQRGRRQAGPPRRTLARLAQVDLGGRVDAGGQRGGQAGRHAGVPVGQALRVQRVLVVLRWASRGWVVAVVMAMGRGAGKPKCSEQGTPGSQSGGVPAASRRAQPTPMGQQAGQQAGRGASGDARTSSSSSSSSSSLSSSSLSISPQRTTRSTAWGRGAGVQAVK